VPYLTLTVRIPLLFLLPQKKGQGYGVLAGQQTMLICSPGTVGVNFRMALMPLCAPGSQLSFTFSIQLTGTDHESKAQKWDSHYLSIIAPKGHFIQLVQFNSSTPMRIDGCTTLIVDQTDISKPKNGRRSADENAMQDVDPMAMAAAPSGAPASDGPAHWKWTWQQVVAWTQKLPGALSQYAENFKHNQTDGHTLAELVRTPY
jgi:hypothetical protein